MAKTPKDIGEVLPPEMSEFTTKKLADYLDTPLIIHSVREVQGQRGVYMRMVVSETETGDKFHISTGASQPVEVLAYLAAHDLFPVICKFIKSGDAIVIKASTK